MVEVVSKNAATKAVMDRPRRLAFTISLFGLVFNCFMAAIYGMTDGFNLFLTFNFLVQTSAIGSITIASYRDWHFRTVLNTAILIIYFHLWGTALYEAYAQKAYVLSFVVLLFIPFYLVLVSGYRVLLAYAAMQGALVYMYVSNFMAKAFG